MDRRKFSKQMLMLGYRLIGNERPDDAIVIFKLNVEMFPESANTYDSLAEGYMISGKKELAIKVLIIMKIIENLN